MIATDNQLKTLNSIIYIIVNKINGKMYVGQSKLTFYKRYVSKKWWKHIRRNNHFRRAIKKYGHYNFEIHLVEWDIYSQEKLDKLEKIYIKLGNTLNPKFGYNKIDGGKGTFVMSSYFKKEMSIRIKKLKTKPFEFYLQKFICKHNDDYIYDSSSYKNSSTKMKIFCKFCNQYFWQTPECHIKGGCQKCKNKRNPLIRDKIFESFVKKARLIHGDRYLYFKDSYKNNKNKTEIQCNTCNSKFFVFPCLHLLYKKGCDKCFPRDLFYRKSFFIEKLKIKFLKKANLIYLNEYICDLANYVNQYSKINIFHKKCKRTYVLQAQQHLKGHGCWRCARDKQGLIKRLKPEEFLEKANFIHKNEYIYDLRCYEKSKSIISIFHKKCGNYFSQIAGSHLISVGCLICGIKTNIKKLKKE